MADSGHKQAYKMSLENPIVQENAKKIMVEVCQGIQEPTERNSQWPKLEKIRATK